MAFPPCDNRVPGWSGLCLLSHLQVRFQSGSAWCWTLFCAFSRCILHLFGGAGLVGGLRHAGQGPGGFKEPCSGCLVKSAETMLQVQIIYLFFLSSLFTFLPRSCRKRAHSGSAERKKGAEVGNGSNGVRPSVAFPALRNAETKMFRGARGSVTVTKGGSHPLLLQPQWIYLINPIPAGYLRRRISRCLRTYHV